MLENFFDIRKNSEEMFQGLEIAKNKELCNAWMNKYPVIFLSLKNVEGLDFPSAYQQLVYEISSLYREHEYLLDSPVLSTQDKFYFQQIRNRKAEKRISCALFSFFPGCSSDIMMKKSSF